MNDQRASSTDLIQRLNQSPVLFFSALATLVFTGALIGYAVSYFQGINSLGLTPSHIDELQTNAQKSIEEIQRLKETNNVLANERDTAVNLVDERKKSSQRQIDDSAAKDSLIKQLLTIASRNGGAPLSINQFVIKPLPEDAFTYRLDLFQAINPPYLAEGSVEIKISGGGKTYRVPMADRLFSFKYTTTLEGRFSIPKGFKADYVDVHVAGTRRNFERRYQWRQGDPIKDFPSTLIQYEQLYGTDEPVGQSEGGGKAPAAPEPPAKPSTPPESEARAQTEPEQTEPAEPTPP